MAHRGSWDIKRNKQRILLSLRFFGQHLSGCLGVEFQNVCTPSLGPQTDKFKDLVHFGQIRCRTHEIPSSSSHLTCGFMASCSKSGTLL